MMRKILAGAAIVAGSLAFSAPAMAVANPTESHYVFTSRAEAEQYCRAGIAAGDWGYCTYKTNVSNGVTHMWTH